MRDSDELNAKNADIDHVTWANSMDKRVAHQIVLFEFAFRQSGGEMGTIDRNVEFLEDIRQRTQMVFVTVGEYYSGYVVPVFFEEVEIGNANINAVSSLFGKAHTGVEDKHLIPITHSHAIHPKLADTAEGNDL